MSTETKAIGKCIGYARNKPEWNALDALAAADAELAALVARAETAEAHVAELERARHADAETDVYQNKRIRNLEIERDAARARVVVLTGVLHYASDQIAQARNLWGEWPVRGDDPEERIDAALADADTGAGGAT